MDPLRILAVGIAHMCTPVRNDVWPGDVRAQLDRHDRALNTLSTSSDYDEWWSANVDRVAAENRLARLLDVTPPPYTPFDYTDGLTRQEQQ